MRRTAIEINGIFQFLIQKQIDAVEASCKKSMMRRASLAESKTYQIFTLTPRMPHATFRIPHVKRPLRRSKLQKSKFTISHFRIPHLASCRRKIVESNFRQKTFLHPVSRKLRKADRAKWNFRISQIAERKMWRLKFPKNFFASCIPQIAEGKICGISIC